LNLEAVSYPKSSSGQVIPSSFFGVYFFFTNLINSYHNYSDSIMKKEKLEKVRLLIQVTNFRSMRKIVKPLYLVETEGRLS
jgi:CMP-2-keto-3-deoxyoctulosonic acid synthetase